MQTLAIVFGGLFGVLAIVLGAFASHLLKNKWAPEILHSFEIGVKYQMYHALLLLLMEFSLPFNNLSSTLAVIFAILGILLFSGSIYGICFFKSKNRPVKLLGPMTPIGGLFFLFAWFFFTVALL